MRRIVVRLLKPVHAVSVENSCYPGTPDVNCTLGWLELKSNDLWPARPSTIVTLKSEFTPQQRVWMLKRWHAGGACGLLLNVDTDWLWFHGDVAAEHIGHTTRAELLDLADAHWPQTPTSGELIECLRLTN